VQPERRADLKKKLWRAGLLGAGVASLLAWQITPAKTGTRSLPDEKAKAAVDEIFSDLTKPGSPGCALAVARDGKIIYENGYGLANIEENVAITPQTVFDIGSTSKQFTAASILLLEKQGKLSVNDDVRKYIPELPDYGKKITILNLLNHTSGIRDYLELMVLAGGNIDSVTDDEDALGIIARQKALNFEPGSEWLYSNSGFFLLSVIVKRVSGKTLAAFAGENIFQPLGMAHTTYRDKHTQLVANRAMAYDEKEHGASYALAVSYFEQTGDGAVHTSAEDILKWDENFYSGQVGGKAFLAELQENGHLNSGKKLDYAKGLFVTSYRGLPTVNHGGAWGGYRAQLARFPEQHFSVACLCNVGNANPSKRAMRVADVYLGSLMKEKTGHEAGNGAEAAKKPAVALSAEEMSGLDGEYRSDELNVTYTLTVDGGMLKLKKIGSSSAFLNNEVLPTDTFSATGKDQFMMRDAGLAVRFERESDGRVKGFKLEAGRVQGIFFAKVAGKS
jgi:CubicO group peptidase (beta-lactamase class C family)